MRMMLRVQRFIHERYVMLKLLSMVSVGAMLAVSAPPPADAGPLREKLKNGTKLAVGLAVIKTECTARKILRKPVGFAC